MKKWFIIQDTTHLGPYAVKDLLEKYELKEIDLDSKVWNNELEFPISYAQFLESIQGNVIKEEIKEPDTPPELPAEVIAQKKNKINIKYLVISFLFVLTVAGGALFYVERDIFEPPAGIALKDFEKAKVQIFEKKKNTFILSKNKKQIFFFTPSREEGKVEVSFHIDIKNSVSRYPIEGKAEAYLKDHVAILEDFTFFKGEELKDGFYFFDLKTKKMSQTSLFSKIRLQDTKDYGLLSTLDDDQFIVAKDEFWKKINDAEIEFWQELYQQYETLFAITKSIQEEFYSIYPLDENYIHTVRRFEREYKENFGVFFTTFVIQNEKNTAVLMKKDFEDKSTILGHYSQLGQLSKILGERTMELLENLEAFNSQREVEAFRLKEKVDIIYGEILKTIENKKEKLRLTYLQ